MIARLFKSKSEVKRVIKQRGIKVNGETLIDSNYILKVGDIIQIGKHRHFKIVE